MKFKLILLPFLVFLLILDQGTKGWMLKRWVSMEPAIQVFDFFNISFVWNRGISFGLFKTIPWIPHALIGLIFCIIVGLGVWFWRETNRLNMVGLGFVLSGALGNLIDRIRFGAVIDFLHFFWDKWHFPTFNVADAAISIGVGLLLVHQFMHSFSYHHSYKGDSKL